MIKNRVKCSFYIAGDVHEAMRLVSEKEHELQSHQIDKAMRLYLNRFRELLLKHGIDIWEE